MATPGTEIVFSFRETQHEARGEYTGTRASLLRTVFDSQELSLAKMKPLIRCCWIQRRDRTTHGAGKKASIQRQTEDQTEEERSKVIRRFSEDCK